ncbi:hypothetical protein VLK31_34795 [Variovorax sp. H27-G14]|uniref:hypothetical protein n=1 Tax=Variovorax sp. H27-G14 TaxID=3111914 RepID=UPI0038FD067C
MGETTRLTLIAACLAFPGLAVAESFKLLCRSYPPDRIVSHVFVVDGDSKTVNDKRATFTDAKIEWVSVDSSTRRGRAVYVDHRIDRHTGIYTAWERGVYYVDAGPTISCDKAPAPKF